MRSHLFNNTIKKPFFISCVDKSMVVNVLTNITTFLVPVDASANKKNENRVVSRDFIRLLLNKIYKTEKIVKIHIS